MVPYQTHTLNRAFRKAVRPGHPTAKSWNRNQNVADFSEVGEWAFAVSGAFRAANAAPRISEKSTTLGQGQHRAPLRGLRVAAKRSLRISKLTTEN